MAEEDFKISIGLDTTGGGTQGSKGTESAMAGGVSKGLKIAGVVGILSSLKVVTDVIGVTLGLLQVAVVSIVGFLGNLLGQFLIKIVPFFDDPFRYLLRFALFIINGIISGIEFGLNMVVSAINLVIKGINKLIPGERFDIPLMEKFEIGRFQETLVLEAYDEFKLTMTELASEGKSFSSDAVKATIGFMKGIGDSFMKNSEFQELMQERINESQIATGEAVDTTKVFADALYNGFNSAAQSFNPAFGAMGSLAQIVIEKSNEIAAQFGRSTGFKQSDANIAFGNATRQSTTLTEKQAKSGLYLLSKGVGG